MAMLISAGQYMNNLTQARDITMSPAEDTLFPGTNAGDGRPSRVAMHGSNAANPYVDVDMAPLDPNTGSTGRSFYARAGSRWNVKGFSGSVTCRIQNLLTKYWLTSAGAWQASQTNCRSSTSTALNFTIEDFDTCKAPVAELELTVSVGTGCTVWPSWNTVHVYGHNLDAGMVVAARYSSDGFSGSNNLKDYLDHYENCCHLATTDVDDRWFRLYSAGTNRSAPWYGEIVVTDATTLNEPNTEGGYEIKRIEPQLRTAGRWGVVSVYNLSPVARRVGRFSFSENNTDQNSLREQIVAACRGGAYPVLLSPVDDEDLRRTPPLYGRLTEEWSETRLFSERWKSDLFVAEDAIATPLG